MEASHGVDAIAAFREHVANSRVSELVGLQPEQAGYDLQKAEGGIYSLDRLEKIGSRRMKRFFLRGKGAHSGYVRARPELNKLVSFKRINLLDPTWPVHGPFDAIFCRNVMIYFDRATQSAILNRFARLLSLDGLLFVGHSESLFHISDLFRLRGKTVYELAKPLARPEQ